MKEEVYIFLKEKLEESYEKEKRGKYICYLKETKVVAIEEKEIINFYFKLNLSSIPNHYIVVTITKDFRIYKMRNPGIQNPVFVKEQDVITIMDIKRDGIFAMERVSGTMLRQRSRYATLKEDKDFSIGSIGRASRTKSGVIFLDFLDIPYRIKVKGKEWKGIEGLNYYLFQCKRDNLELLKSDDIYSILRKKYNSLWNRDFNETDAESLRKKINQTMYCNYHFCGYALFYKKVGPFYIPIV